MIASFFQHLDDHGVDWLLISGQATILYGAATFSEDVDLWIAPTATNFKRFVHALRASGARYYKLTPPFALELAARHHGFHFVVPEPRTGADVYLDVMGYPPRVGPFETAKRRSRRFDTEWGRLNTVGIVDLVELKKTQRAQDYPIISRLALALLRERNAASQAELSWAIDHMFSLTELARLLLDCPDVGRVLSSAPTVIQRAAEQLSSREQWDASLEDELEDWFDQKSAPLRKADRRFWKVVIDELRTLRSRGELVPEGVPV